MAWYQNGLRFKCTGCGQCCTGASGYVYLSNEDLERLSKAFSITPAQFVRKYCRFAHGSYALLDKPGTDACIFLKENRCTAYESRPTQCRTFPWWKENVKSEEAWAEAAKDCEGINHMDAPLISLAEIERSL